MCLINNMHEVEGKIIGVHKGKSGVNEKTGKSWQIWDVVIAHPRQPNGGLFKTFDDQFLRLLGQEGKFEYTEDKWGKTLQRLPRQSQGNRMNEEFGKLHRKLDEILELISIRTPIKDNTSNEDGPIPF